MALTNPYADTLCDIERELWEHDLLVEQGHAQPYQYNEATFRACLKIFMSALLWRMWLFQNQFSQAQAAREIAAERAGSILRRVIRRFTGIDAHALYR